MSDYSNSCSGWELPDSIPLTSEPQTPELSNPFSVRPCDISASSSCLTSKSFGVVTSSINITDVCSGVEKLSVIAPINNLNQATFSRAFGSSISSNIFPVASSSNMCFLEIPNIASSVSIPEATLTQNRIVMASDIITKSFPTSETGFPSSSSTVSSLSSSYFVKGALPKMVVDRKRQYRLLKKSPLKTSPLKKVSPILRQQFRRNRKCKVNSPRKLKFILPKQMRKKRPRALRAKSVIPEISNTQVNTSLKGDIQGALGSYRAIQVSSIPLGTSVSQPTYNMQVLEASASASTGPVNTSNQFHVQQCLEQNQEDGMELEVEDSITEQQQLLQEEHLAAFLKASSTIALQRGGKKKAVGGLNKQQKILQEKITFLSYSPDLKSQENELAMSYLIRVRKALTSKDPKNFASFMALFNNYSRTNDSPENLYYKACDLLQGFAELKEEFVMFLTADQAVKVGKFHEFCMFNQIREFIDELKYHSARQVQNFSKIFKTFQTLQSRPNITKEEFFDVVTPILRFQPHLIEGLNQLLPTSHPVESIPEDFEVINLDNEKEPLPEDFEVINMVDTEAKVLTESCFCQCHTGATSNANAQSSQQAKMEHCVSCGLRFIEGRVYLQHGKSLRPAKIIYVTDGKDEDTTVEDNCPPSETHNKVKVPRKVKDASEKTVKLKTKNKCRRIKICDSSTSDIVGKTKKGKSSKRKFSKVQK